VDRTFCLALSACLWALEVAAFADGPAATTASARVVEIIAIPDADRIGMLRDVLGPHPFASASIRWLAMARFDKRDVLRSEPTRDDVAVRAWVDLSDPKATVLYFANGAAQRFLVRELRLSPTFEANDREAVGQVLMLSIGALLEDSGGGLDRRSAQSLLDPGADDRSRDPPAPPLAERPTASSGRPPFDVTVFYAAQAFAREIPVVHGPGLEALAEVRAGRVAVSLWVSAQYQVPSTFEQDGIGLERWSAALRGGIEGALGLRSVSAAGAFSSVFVGGSVGLGSDLVHVTPLPGTSGGMTNLALPYWSLDPVAAVALRFQATLLPRVDVAVSPLADVYLAPAHYDFRSGGVVSTVLAPFPVRPGLMVGLAIH
jgi:hypothetical protein